MSEPTFKFKVGEIVTPANPKHPKANWPCKVMAVEHVKFSHKPMYGEEYHVDYVCVHVLPLSNWSVDGISMAEEGFVSRPDLAANLHPSWLAEAA